MGERKVSPRKPSTLRKHVRWEEVITGLLGVVLSGSIITVEINEGIHYMRLVNDE